MQYCLTPTNAEDRSWLDELRRAVYHDLFVATWGGWDEARHLRHFAESWKRGGISIIDLDGVRVGMIQLLEGDDALEVAEIQIHPLYQGRGIGTRLLHDTIAQAHSRAKMVTLSTGLQNHRAVELYRRLGFEHASQTEAKYYMVSHPEA